MCCRRRRTRAQVWRGGLVALVTDVWQDVRFGVRMLVKNPGFSLVVIAVLSLGIAGNAAIFSLFKGLALKPLPGVRDSATSSPCCSAAPSTAAASACRCPTIATFAAQQQSFERPDGVDDDLRQPRPRRRRRSASSRSWSTGNYFEMLGVGAQLGRTLLPSDDVAPGQHPVAVISDALWRRSFGADPAIVGKTIYLNGQPLTVVGVAGAGVQRHHRQHGHRRVRADDDAAAAVAAEPARLARHLRHDDDRAPQARRDRSQAATARSRACSRRNSTPNIRSRTITRALDVVPIWQSPFGAQTYWLPAIARARRHGHADPAGRLRQRRQPRAGPRRQPARRARRPARARREPRPLAAAAVRREPGAGGAWRAGRRRARVCRCCRSWRPAPRRPRRRASISTRRSTATCWRFAIALSCACAIVFGFVPALRDVARRI